jgi:hypothetical protein
MPHVDLERIVHEELRALPLPAAPPTLLPRVIAAVHAWAERPWYARAWFTWPLAWQMASAAALLALVAAGFAVAPIAQDTVPAFLTAHASGPLTAWARAAHDVDEAIAAVRIMWRALAAPLVPYLFALVMAMCLACAAFGTALNRAAFGRI